MTAWLNRSQPCGHSPEPKGDSMEVKRSTAKIEKHENHKKIPTNYLVLRVFDEDKYPFRLTVSRARLIIRHMEDLKDFVENYGNNGKMTLRKLLQ
jgi:hypothetical protein